MKQCMVKTDADHFAGLEIIVSADVWA